MTSSLYCFDGVLSSTTGYIPPASEKVWATLIYSPQMAIPALVIEWILPIYSFLNLGRKTDFEIQGEMRSHLSGQRISIDVHVGTSIISLLEITISVASSE